MNILEVLSVKMPSTSGRKFYEVPLNDILLSHQMLEQGCPVPGETECPPLFQTRLISREVLDDFVQVWSRLEDDVRGNNGELVVSDSREGVRYRFPGRENARLNITDRVRERGLDEILSQTFPCSDALSSIPDPRVEVGVLQ